MDSELQGTNTSVPMMVKPITTVPLSKPKGKTPTKSSSKRKKPAKLKSGTTETTLSMNDVYEKKNPLISTIIKPNFGTSEKDSKSIDVEATVKTIFDVVSSKVKKGNPDVILKSFASESNRNIGLENLDTARDSPEHINMYDPKTDDKIMEEDSIQCSPEKIDEQEDVELNVETFMSQQDKQDNDDGISKEDESGQETGSDKGVSSGHYADKPPLEEEEHISVEADPEEDVYGNKGDEDMVNVDDIVSDDISLVEREVESVANRIRSNKGKAVLTEVETPKTKNKTVVVGPKKVWSKVKVKSTSRRTRKRKVV